MTTKRQKLQAMAEQTVSPHEAAVAAAMLAKTPESTLERIAEDIRAEVGRSLEAQFSIGGLLSEARAMFPSDIEFGRWFKAQDFPFTSTTAWHLRVGFERKPEVMLLLQQREGQREVGLHYAVKLLLGQTGRPVDNVTEAFEQVQTDQNYAALRAAHHRILGSEVNEDGELVATDNAFARMHIDDLASSANLLQELVAAYQSARKARS